MLEMPVDEETLAVLATKTEGWPAGLYLAALFVKQQGGLEGTKARVQEIDAYTLEYLADEVRARQPEAVKNSS